MIVLNPVIVIVLWVKFVGCFTLQGVRPMPILQLFPPANPFALAVDHDYLHLNPEDQWLKDNKVMIFITYS